MSSISELQAYIAKEEEHAKLFAEEIASFGAKEDKLMQIQHDLQVCGAVRSRGVVSFSG